MINEINTAGECVWDIMSKYTGVEDISQLNEKHAARLNTGVL